MHRMTATALLAGCVIAAGTIPAFAHGGVPNVAQVVALDECDPETFNAMFAAGGDPFCHNVALPAFGFTTKFEDFIKGVNNGTPDPGWDFEPDQLTIPKGTSFSVVNQGGEPHTFTEVAQFGGGSLPALNHGEPTVPECKDGFSNVAVAKTRIIQGSRIDVTGLSKGKHLFQCCIHPWMRMEVDVK